MEHHELISISSLPPIERFPQFDKVQKIYFLGHARLHGSNLSLGNEKIASNSTLQTEPLHHLGSNPTYNLIIVNKK